MKYKLSEIFVFAPIYYTLDGSFRVIGTAHNLTALVNIGDILIVDNKEYKVNKIDHNYIYVDVEGFGWKKTKLECSLCIEKPWEFNSLILEFNTIEAK